jgi:hypothetical protein
MADTVKAGMFVPEIATEVATAEFPNKLVLAASPAVVPIPADTLGSEGDLIKFPRYNPLAEFDEISEGVSLTPEALRTSQDFAPVFQGGKAVEITDFASLAARGDPSTEVGRQIAELAARYVDNKLVLEAETTALVKDITGETLKTFNYDSFVDAILDKWGDKAFDAIGALVVHPVQLKAILKDTNFTKANETGQAQSPRIIGLRAIGLYLGYPLFVSGRITVNAGSPNTYDALILKAGALGFRYQRSLLVENDRDILAKSDVIAADVRGAVHLHFGEPLPAIRFRTQ